MVTPTHHRKCIDLPYNRRAKTMAALFLSQPRYLGSPLCLENICRINLLFRLEEYPIQQLLLLPPPVRRDLSLGLSLVDVLHYEAAGLFHDVDIAGVVESARQKLLNVALGTRCNLTDLGFIPSILPALVPEKHLEEPNSILEHISESFSSLPFTVKHLWPTMIFPNRFISIISPMDSGVDHYKKSFEMLLQYCHFLTAPKEVRLDVYYFTGSPLWVKFDKKMVIRDPVIPFLQSFLSLVETIELESIALTNKYDKNFVTKECSTMQATSYVILYNILTSQQPCLKHIKIYEVHRVIEMILNTVEKFFSDCHNYFPTSQEFPLHLATPPPAPYPLKCLSITHEPVAECDEPVGEYFRLDREYAANISFSTRAIVLYQLHSLEHLSINCGTDFCYGSRLDCEGVSSEKFAERSYSIPEHRALLSTLTDLLNNQVWRLSQEQPILRLFRAPLLSGRG